MTFTEILKSFNRSNSNWYASVIKNGKKHVYFFDEDPYITLKGPYLNDKDVYLNLHDNPSVTVPFGATVHIQVLNKYGLDIPYWKYLWLRLTRQLVK